MNEKDRIGASNGPKLRFGSNESVRETRSAAPIELEQHLAVIGCKHPLMYVDAWLLRDDGLVLEVGENQFMLTRRGEPDERSPVAIVGQVGDIRHATPDVADAGRESRSRRDS